MNSIVCFVLLHLVALNATEDIILTPVKEDEIQTKLIEKSGPLKIVCIGTGETLKWRFNAGNQPKEAVEIVEAERRIIAFENFNSSEFDGLYSCINTMNNDRARLRLLYDDGRIPDRFTRCPADKASFCVHEKSCMVDESGSIICRCMTNWGGPRCSEAILLSGKITLETCTSTTDIIVWVVIVTAICFCQVIVYIKLKEADKRRRRYCAVDVTNSTIVHLV